MSLQSLFSPKSIALVGASTTVGSVGNDLAKNLVQGDFSGQVFFVNPKAETLLGQRCYASIKDISEHIDLAIIVVPAAIVPAVLKESGEKMVRAAVIISSGFRETGEAGASLEKEIRGIAQEFHISLLGPNCLGFIAPQIFLNASFASAVPHSGDIAFFSQSGALMSALLDQAKEDLGFSIFASLGNKTITDENELLHYFKNDSGTRVLGFYTEGLSDANKFITASRALIHNDPPKPVIALKSGQTKAGAGASSSHTGAIAGASEAYTALFRQARVIQAKSFSELLDLLEIVSKNPLPKGNGLAIVTNAGGLGVLATDAAVENGLELAQLGEETQKKLRTLLPPAANVSNPVDVLGDALADRYAHAIETVAEDPAVHLLLVILTPQTMTKPSETAEAIVRLRQNRPDLPIVAIFAGHDLVSSGLKILSSGHIASIAFPEAGAQGLGRLASLGVWSREGHFTLLPPPDTIRRDEATTLMKTFREAKKSQLNEMESVELLSHYGFPFSKSGFAENAEKALAIANEIGRPVALKIVSPDIIHKSDVGGVLLNVSPEDADQAFLSLLESVKQHKPDARIDGALVVEMAPNGGRELLLGLKKEPGLGTLLVLGLGGIYVETLRDVAMRFIPLMDKDIDEMLLELSSYALLAGTRGQTGIDIEALKDYIARLNQLAQDHPEIAALDLNPLLAFPNAQDFRVLDARITLSQ